MKLSKVLSALMLLLISSSGFSFCQVEDTSGGTVVLEDHISSELTEGHVFSYDSTLSAPIQLQSIQFFPSHFYSSGFCSSHWETIAVRNTRYSNLIDPGLGIEKIIFPFHSFL